jgi:2'-5' RNA ligase
MFPLTESISEDKLVDHLQNILSEIEPFPIHLRGLQKSVDDYLFLLVDQGKEDIVDLHMRVYSELLENRRRSSLRYVPHLTLGDFSNKLDEYPQALAEAKQLDLNYRCMLDRLDLLKLHDEPRQIVWSKQFEIG